MNFAKLIFATSNISSPINFCHELGQPMLYVTCDYHDMNNLVNSESSNYKLTDSMDC